MAVRKGVGVAFVLAILRSSTAMAQSPPPVSVRLDYSVEPTVTGCPDEQELRDALRAETGRDLLSPDAPTIMRVDVSGGTRGVHWIVRHLDAEGRTLWERAPISGARCSALLDPVVFALKTHFAPAAGPTRAPPAPPTRADARTTTALPPAPGPERLSSPSTRPTPPRERLTFRMGSGAWALFGATPDPATLGLSVDLGVRWSVLSTAIEARSSLPTSLELRPRPGLPSDHITVFMRTLALIPCVHHRFLVACALGQVGEVNSSATATKRGLQAAFGGRIGAELDLLARLHVRAGLDLLGTARTLTVCGAGDEGGGCPETKGRPDTWTQPRLLGALGAGLFGNF